MHVEMAAPGMMLPSVDAGNGAQNKLTLTLMLSYLIQTPRLRQPCKYVLNEESGVSDDWLLQYVVPNICMEFPRNVALTLARPLLWAAFEPSLLGFLPGKLTQQIQMAYALVRNLPPGTNPVGKRLIVVNGAEAELYIDEI